MSLPSLTEFFLQLLVYFIVDDYGVYWIHRWLHCKWCYENIHKVHHEFTAPIALVAVYAHWADILVMAIPSFIGPAMVPCHMITFWLWIIIRLLETTTTHSGYANLSTNDRHTSCACFCTSHNILLSYRIHIN